MTVAATGRTLLLTGIPRGGTTLACRLLGQAKDTVALFEPMDVASLPAAPAAAVDAIAAFAAAARAQLLAEGRAPSKQTGGQVPDNPFLAPDPATGERRLQATPGLLELPSPPLPGFTLAIKHNAAFTALLRELAARFEVLALVRHPLAVLASWHSVDLPVGAGRVPAGERLDPALAARLQAEPDRIARQLAILDWCFGRFAALPAARVLRYEDIVASGGECLYAAAGVAGTPQSLAGRNANPAYRRVDIDALAARLRAHDGPCWRWYARDSVEALAARMREERGG